MWENPLGAGSSHKKIKSTIIEIQEAQEIFLFLLLFNYNFPESVNVSSKVTLDDKV